MPPRAGKRKLTTRAATPLIAAQVASAPTQVNQYPVVEEPARLEFSDVSAYVDWGHDGVRIKDLMNCRKAQAPVWLRSRINHAIIETITRCKVRGMRENNRQGDVEPLTEAAALD